LSLSLFSLSLPPPLPSLSYAFSSLDLKKVSELQTAATDKQREEAAESVELLRARVIVLRHRAKGEREREKRERILQAVASLDQILTMLE
jgi:hypothetical protein